MVTRLIEFISKTGLAGAIMLATAFHSFSADRTHGKKDRHLLLYPRVIANVRNAQLALEVTGMSAPRLLTDKERQSSTASPSTAVSPMGR